MVMLDNQTPKPPVCLCLVMACLLASCGPSIERNHQATEEWNARSRAAVREFASVDTTMDSSKMAWALLMVQPEVSWSDDVIAAALDSLTSDANDSVLLIEIAVQGEVATRICSMILCGKQTVREYRWDNWALHPKQMNVIELTIDDVASRLGRIRNWARPSATRIYHEVIVVTTVKREEMIVEVVADPAIDFSLEVYSSPTKE